MMGWLSADFQLDQRAIDTLLRLARQYRGHGIDVAKQGTGAVKGAHSDNSLQLAEADLKVFIGFTENNKLMLINIKTLIERFANGTSSEDLFDSINQIYRDADRDPELKNWFKQMDAYIQKCLKEQGFILQDQATEEWNEIGRAHV